MLNLNRQSRVTLCLNIIIAVVATGLVNAAIFATGLVGSSAVASVSFAPPGWVIGAVWTVLYMIMAGARWRAAGYSAAGRRASWWIVGFMVWGLLYPLTSGGFNAYFGALNNVASLLFIMFVYLRVRRAAPPAALWLWPTLLWVGFATILGATALFQAAA